MLLLASVETKRIENTLAARLDRSFHIHHIDLENRARIGRLAID